MSKKIPVKQITSWSFSRYADYSQCALKAKLKHIDKIQEPPNDAMARGADIHDKAAGYLKGLIKKLPLELRLVKKELDQIKKLMKQKVQAPIVEDTWAVTKAWIATAWNDWGNCWLRVKMDAAFYEDSETLFVRDWKTGKYRPNEQATYVEQLELYAATAFKLLPHVQTVRCLLNYVDHGLTYPEDGPLIFTREADAVRLQKLWEKRVKPMLSDTVFAPRPNDKCCWCFYRKANKANGGGQCKY